jgi:hypothetical protein
MHLLPKISPRTSDQRRADFRSSLMRREAAIGGKLFGPVPKGHKRSFFCLDRHTWIWHEEWMDKSGRRVVTTRYEVRPDGVIKTQDGQAAQKLSATEARHLYDAVDLYQRRVEAEYGRILQAI